MLMLLALAACVPADVGPTSAPQGTSSGTSVPSSAGTTFSSISKQALKGTTIGVWYPWFGVEASLFESLVAEFNQSNEWGIRVATTNQGSYSELYNNVTTSLPGGDHPQVVVALPEYPIAWDAGRYVVDLTEYVRDRTYGLSVDEVRDFPSVFWSQDLVGARRLAVPAERTARFILYEDNWARELGFAAAPADASSFRQQACRAHQAMSLDQDRQNDAEGGWLVNSSSMTFLSWLMAFGGGVLEGNGYHLLTPKNLAALTFVKQLYDDGCAWTAQSGQDAASAFAGRTALFATASLEQLSDYTRAMAAADNADAWTVLAFPGPEQTGLIVYGSSYVVLKSTPTQQLASWIFIRWMLSSENQKKWVEATGLFPLRESALALLGEYRKSHPQWSAAVDLLPEAQIEPQLASWRQVRVMLGDGFDAMFRSNTPAGRVAEILAIMEKAASDLSK